MAVRTLTLLLAFAAAMSAADRKPAAEFKLSSTLHCRYPSHTPIALRFAPSNDRIALALQHEPEEEGSSVHLVVASPDGKIVRHVRGLPGPARQRTVRDEDFLWWSPDGRWVAFAGLESVTMIQPEGTDRYDIPLEGAAEQIPLGFVSGPMFIVAAGRSPDRNLNAYSTAGKLLQPVAVAVDFDAVAISPEGEQLALISKGKAVITDVRGESRRAITFDPSLDRPRLFGPPAKGRYTDSGQVLCIAAQNHTYCFDSDSAEQITQMPPGMIGRMTDASADGPRIVYSGYASSALGLAAGLAAVQYGHGGDANDLPACVVWDYRKGKEILKWSPGVAETIGLPQLVRGRNRAAFALSPTGNCLAVARGTSVQLYDLPPD